MANCVEEGKIQCPDGSCADDLSKCAQLTEEDYNPDIGWTAEGEFITDDKSTAIDESLYDIYEGIGGAEWTGLEYEDWKNKYGDEYPTWAGGEYEVQADLIESQIALLGSEYDIAQDTADLKSDSLRFTKGAEFENIAQNKEASHRAGGGTVTGQGKKKFESAYDKVLSGFDFEAEAQQLALESSMVNLESRRLGYEADLSSTVLEFQNRMWDMIAARKEAEYGGDCEDGSERDCKGVCGGTATYDQCGVCGGNGSTCTQQVTDERDDIINDPSDTGIDEQYEDEGTESGEGFGEDMAYDDWGDEYGDDYGS